MQYWWIKQRNNPQIGTYYVACGQLPNKDAMKMESTLYGRNKMEPYPTEAAYLARIYELKASGEKVQ